jgi:hypothetical protein
LIAENDQWRFVQAALAERLVNNYRKDLQMDIDKNRTVEEEKKDAYSTWILGKAYI